MNVFVTGFDGYVGTVLSTMLRSHGHDVDGADTFWFSDADPLDRRDVRDLGPDHLAGVDCVIHLAALSNDPMGRLSPRCTSDINHAATVRLARAARQAGVRRFVFASTCSVYGRTGQDVVDEREPIGPLTEYARSKGRAEQALASLKSERFSPVMLRFPTLYGPSPRVRTDLVVNELVAQACAGIAMRLTSDGSAWRPLLHVEDACRAYLAVLEAPPALTHGEVYNVATDTANIRVIDAARAIADRIDGARLVVSDGARPDARSYRADFGKFERAFPAFRARDLATGIRQLAQFYATLPGGPEAVLRLRRLDQLTSLIERGLVDDELRWRQGHPARGLSART